MKGIHQKESRKQEILMLKLVKWEEEILPEGLMFEVILIGFKPFSSSNASKRTTHPRKAHILAVVQSMFMI